MMTLTARYIGKIRLTYAKICCIWRVFRHKGLFWCFRLMDVYVKWKKKKTKQGRRRRLMNLLPFKFTFFPATNGCSDTHRKR